MSPKKSLELVNYKNILPKQLKLFNLDLKFLKRLENCLQNFRAKIFALLNPMKMDLIPIHFVLTRTKQTKQKQ